jgi:hypothetical protein
MPVFNPPPAGMDMTSAIGATGALSPPHPLPILGTMTTERLFLGAAAGTAGLIVVVAAYFWAVRGEAIFLDLGAWLCL